jgi:hypothetical protein
MRRFVATLFLTGALAAGSVAPGSAALNGPIVTGGLVNITVVDVLNNNTVTLDRVVNVAAAVNIAANVCNVPVSVLSADYASGDLSATCTNEVNGVVATINQP